MATSSNTDSPSRISGWLVLTVLLAVIVCANIWRPAVAAGGPELRDPANMTLRIWPGKPVATSTLSQADVAAESPSAAHALEQQSLPHHAYLKQTQPGQ